MKIHDIIQEDIMPKHFSQMHGKRSKHHEIGPNTKTKSNYMSTTYDPATNTLDTDLEKTERIPGQGRKYTKKTSSSKDQWGHGHDRSWTNVNQQKGYVPAQDWGEKALNPYDRLSSISDRTSDRRFTPSSISKTQTASDHDVRSNKSATDTATTTKWDPGAGKNVVTRVEPADMWDAYIDTGSVGSDFTVRKASGALASPAERLANQKAAFAHAQANYKIDPRKQKV